MYLSKRCPFLGLLTIMVICAFGAVVLNRSDTSSATDRLDQDTQINMPQRIDTSVVHLYFSDKENSYLIAEEWKLSHSNNPAEFGRAIIEALIQGPREGLMPTVPAGTAVRALYVTPDKVAYVDMTAMLRDAHPGGVQSELMTIYSIVNSLILNISQIDAVSILIDGREAMTLAGHIDLRFPFRANMLLIR
jgi:hypothetical protein